MARFLALFTTNNGPTPEAFGTIMDIDGDDPLHEARIALVAMNNGIQFGGFFDYLLPWPDGTSDSALPLDPLTGQPVAIWTPPAAPIPEGMPE